MSALAGNRPGRPGWRRTSLAHWNKYLWRPRHPAARSDQPEAKLPQRRANIFPAPRLPRRVLDGGNLSTHENRPLVPDADSRDCGLRRTACRRDELSAAAAEIYDCNLTVSAATAAAVGSSTPNGAMESASTTAAPMPSSP